MSGMEPMLIGAALGGGISAARGGNPLTGALLGGVTGGVGSGLWSAASSAAGAGAGSSLASGIAAQPALGYAGAQTAAGQAMANPGIWATMKELPGAAIGMAKSNPQAAMQGASLLNDMTQTNPVQMPGASPILHGQAPQQNDMYLASLLQGQRQPVSLI